MQKVQVSNNRHAGGSLSSYRSGAGPLYNPRACQEEESELELLKQSLRQNVIELVGKIRAIRAEDWYQKHYSFAVRYLIRLMDQ